MQYQNRAAKAIKWIIFFQLSCALFALSSRSAYSQTVYVTSGNGISAVDSSQQTVLATIPTSAGFLTMSQDGSRLYASAFNGLDVIDVSTNTILTTVPVGANPFESCLSPDGKRLYVTHFDSSSVFIIDTSNNAIISTIPVPGNPIRIAISPDASRIYVSTRFNGVAVVNPATNSVVHQVAGMSSTFPSSISFLPDSSRAYIGESGGPLFYIVDARNDALIQTVMIAGADGGISGVTKTPDGSRIYLTNVRTSPTQGPGAVFAVDTSTNTVAAKIPIGGATTQIAISSDGSKVFVGDSDTGNLDVIDVANNSITASVHVSDLNLIAGVATKPPTLATTIAPQLFYEDTTASQRVITQLAVDNAGNVVSFTLQTSFGCGFGICGTVVYSIAPGGSVNWITSDTHFIANTVNEIAIDSSNNIFFQDFFSLGKIQGVSSSGSVLPNWPITINTALDTFSPSLLIDPVDQSVIAKGGSASAFEPPSTRTASFRHDGSAKWVTDLVGGGDNTPGMVLGPNNNIYTFSDHTVLLDRNDGHVICEFPALGGDSFAPITGGDGLVFSYTATQVLRSDSGCTPFPIYNWEPTRRGQLLGYDQGTLFAFDFPNNGFTGTARLIAISKDGLPLWQNNLIFPLSIAATRQGLVYVVGLDANSACCAQQKLFVVDESSGNITASTDLTAICPACLKVAVGPSGIYAGDLSSTRIYKLNGIGAVSNTGTINISTNIAAAKFTIVGPITITGNGLSFSQTNVPPGTYTITFDGVTKFLSPVSQTATLDPRGVLTFSASYTAVDLGVLPNPPPSTIGSTSPGSGSVLGISTVNPQMSVQEPISTGNGNYYHQNTDLGFASRGIGIAFSRTYNSLDSYTGPLGANWTHSYNIFLVSTSSGVLIKWGDGHGENFSWTGSAFVPQVGVHSALARNGDGTFILTTKSQVKYLFDTFGKLASVTDRNGNSLTFTYDPTGSLNQITDSVGRALVITNDSSNRIQQITGPLGRKVTFAYDSNNNLVSATDAAGGITQYQYDMNHRINQIIQPNGISLLQNSYDAQGRVTTQTNGRGFTWIFAYNTPASGQTTITDARGNKTIHIYDSSLRITSITDATGGITSFDYDSQNNRTGITDANGHSTRFTYDIAGNLLSGTDALGHKTQFTYDSDNNLLSTSSPLGHTTAFVYDPRGNLTSITDPLGNVTRLAYNIFGELISRIDPNGNTTIFNYDNNGNLVKSVDPLGNTKTMTYDDASRFVSLTDARGHRSSIFLDNLDRIIKTVNPLGHTTEFAYDAISNLTRLTDANGHVTIYEYDSANNLSVVTDALNHLTKYGYDQNNNRIALLNARGKTATYSYDPVNRLSSSIDPLGNTKTYAYDHGGKVISTTDGNGITNTLAYDSTNRITKISYGDGKTVAYAYDSDGRRISMTDQTGLTLYTYDTMGRLLSVTNSAGKVVQYGYNANGNRASLTYPDGKMVNYSYDAAGRMAQVTDWNGGNIIYGYDEANNLTAIQYPNHAQILLGYDDGNQLIKITNAAKDGRLLSYSYTFDAVGNRIGVVRNGSKTKYEYDALNQLVRQINIESSPDNKLENEHDNISWVYDPVGNRISQSDKKGTIEYIYDAADRVISAVSHSGDGADKGAESATISHITTFTYDGNGSLISKMTGRHSTQYSYSSATRLMSVKGPGIDSSFRYDGDGNRIGQSTAFGAYEYVNDVAGRLSEVLTESGSEGSITFVYGLNLIEEVGPSFNYFYQFDGLGSIVGLTGRMGEIVTTYEYDPWGKSVGGESIGLQNKFRFAGEFLDPETNLYYLRARYLDPTVGRMLTVDPLAIVLHGGRPLMKYSYADDRPLNETDPSGLYSLSDFAHDIGGFAKDIGQSIGEDIVTGAIKGGSFALKTFGDFSSTIGGTIGGIEAKVGGLNIFGSVKSGIADFLTYSTIHWLASNGGATPVGDAPWYLHFIPLVHNFFDNAIVSGETIDANGNVYDASGHLIGSINQLDMNNKSGTASAK